MSVAKTILSQLGGNKFAVMTGAKNFIDTGGGLSMRIGRNKTSSNYLKVTLNSMDLYDMKFSRVSPKGGERSITEYNNIFNDFFYFCNFFFNHLFRKNFFSILCIEYIKYFEYSFFNRFFIFQYLNDIIKYLFSSRTKVFQ